MAIKYHDNVEQGSDEWFDMRCGLLTASEMKLVITPTLKIANNDKTRSHVYEIASQRVNRYVEPTYVSDEMMRGHEEEVLAKIAYSLNYEEVSDVGFVTNDEFGFMMGCSPDGLVGTEGMVEIKSRKQKFQFETILSRGVPKNPKLDCMLQIQTSLLVTGRKWCDFITYSGGMPMMTVRVLPNLEMQEKILEAARAFEEKVGEKIAEYHEALGDKELRFVETERRIEDEIVV